MFFFSQLYILLIDGVYQKVRWPFSSVNFLELKILRNQNVLYIYTLHKLAFVVANMFLLIGGLPWTAIDWKMPILVAKYFF